MKAKKINTGESIINILPSSSSTIMKNNMQSNYDQNLQSSLKSSQSSNYYQQPLSNSNKRMI